MLLSPGTKVSNVKFSLRSGWGVNSSSTASAFSFLDFFIGSSVFSSLDIVVLFISNSISISRPVISFILSFMDFTTSWESICALIKSLATETFMEFPSSLIYSRLNQR